MLEEVADIIIIADAEFSPKIVYSFAVMPLPFLVIRLKNIVIALLKFS